MTRLMTVLLLVGLTAAPAYANGLQKMVRRVAVDRALVRGGLFKVLRNGTFTWRASKQHPGLKMRAWEIRRHAHQLAGQATSMVKEGKSLVFYAGEKLIGKLTASASKRTSGGHAYSTSTEINLVNNLGGGTAETLTSRRTAFRLEGEVSIQRKGSVTVQSEVRQDQVNFGDRTRGALVGRVTRDGQDTLTYKAGKKRLVGFGPFGPAL